MTNQTLADKLATIQNAIEDARTSIEAAFYSLDKAQHLLDGLRADVQKKEEEPARNWVFPKHKKGLENSGGEIDIMATPWGVGVKAPPRGCHYTAISCVGNLIFSCKFYGILKEGDNLKFCQRPNGDLVMKIVAQKTGIEVFSKTHKSGRSPIKANVKGLFIKLGWIKEKKESVKVLFTLEAEGVFKMERR